MRCTTTNFNLQVVNSKPSQPQRHNLIKPGQRMAQRGCHPWLLLTLSKRAGCLFSLRDSGQSSKPREYAWYISAGTRNRAKDCVFSVLINCLFKNANEEIAKIVSTALITWN